MFSPSSFQFRPLSLIYLPLHPIPEHRDNVFTELWEAKLYTYIENRQYYNSLHSNHCLQMDRNKTKESTLSGNKHYPKWICTWFLFACIFIFVSVSPKFLKFVILLENILCLFILLFWPALFDESYIYVYIFQHLVLNQSFHKEIMKFLKIEFMLSPIKNNIITAQQTLEFCFQYQHLLIFLDLPNDCLQSKV
jgi:hypothetical protein